MRMKYSVDPQEVVRGSRAFRSHEKRDAIYRVSTFLVNHSWGKPPEMADALGVLLLVWNNAFYRYGMFDFAELETALRKNMSKLKAYRLRNILSFSDEDDKRVEELFYSFLDALKIADGKKKGMRSPVSVAKALHLLAPEFFPLWDDKIAKAYGCDYRDNPAGKYLLFMEISRKMVQDLRDSADTRGTTFLKMIDEYNYAKFTKRWI